MHHAGVRGFLKLLRWPSYLPMVAQSHSIPLGSGNYSSEVSARVSSTTISTLIFFYLNVYT